MIAPGQASPALEISIKLPNCAMQDNGITAGNASVANHKWSPCSCLFAARGGEPCAA
jgi:hypothetical protein